MRPRKRDHMATPLPLVCLMGDGFNLKRMATGNEFYSFRSFEKKFYSFFLLSHTKRLIEFDKQNKFKQLVTLAKREEESIKLNLKINMIFCKLFYFKFHSLESRLIIFKKKFS